MNENVELMGICLKDWDVMDNIKKPMIYIVDDDYSVRRAMKRLMRSVGMEAEVFPSGKEFLKHDFREKNACMIVDIRLEEETGLELQENLRAAGSDLPIIFITGFDNEETRNRAKNAGAAGYFKKPVDDQALLDTIQWALVSNAKDKTI